MFNNLVKKDPFKRKSNGCRLRTNRLVFIVTASFNKLITSTYILVKQIIVFLKGF